MNFDPGEICEEQVFKGLNGDGGETAGVVFERCRFTRGSFREASFRACRFRDCVFEKCDLSLAKVEKCSFAGVRFEDSKLVGVDWTAASWAKREIQRSLPSLDFVRCALDYSTFRGLTLEKMQLKRCTAKEVDFTETDLKQADCTFTDFEGSLFAHTDLGGADLRGAVRYSINPLVNTLKKALFSLPEAMSLLDALEIEISAAPGEDGVMG